MWGSDAKKLANKILAAGQLKNGYSGVLFSAAFEIVKVATLRQLR